MTRTLAAAVGLALVLGPSASLPSATPAVPVRLAFTDITAEAGIDFVHVTGATGRKYPVETMGSGAVFFDYDGDGDPDLYLVNSAALPGFQARGPARGALLRNEGAGRFTDVAVESGLVDEATAWGPWPETTTTTAFPTST
jgi:hypothetical protein